MKEFYKKKSKYQAPTIIYDDEFMLDVLMVSQGDYAIDEWADGVIEDDFFD